MAPNRRNWRLMALMPDGTRRYLGDGYPGRKKALEALTRMTIPANAKVFAVRDIHEREVGGKR